MKLYYYKDNPLVYQCADKYRVREYVRECGLEHILNELTATYKSPEDINWDVLPDRFVLKWNFGCGGNVICFDKKQIDKAKAMKELKEFQKIKAHLICAEPQYKMEKLLLCERFIESEDGAAPTDYKFYCFNGEAKYVLCCYNRSENRKPAFYFFDKNWQLQRFNQRATTHAAPYYDYNPITGQEMPPFSHPDNISVMAVDTCPNALALDTSDYFGQMLMQHVFPPLLNRQHSDILQRGTILQNGQLTPLFRYLDNFSKS